MDYDTILNTVGEKPEHMYTTERGSTYAHYKDNSTVRNRSGKNHKDKAEGLQPRSGKTVYMRPEDVNKMAGMYQNSELSTAFKPSFYDKETKTGKVALTHAEDFGPKKVGSVIHEAKFTTTPAVGLNPVEIYRSESPKGDSGKGVHWGSKITEVRGGGGNMAGMGGQKNSMGMIDPSAVTSLIPNYKNGGVISMPKEYSVGSWKLI
tara:strand:- start:320 stop:937 length:618 start_codon:yes stop_codon:yes gene_type:complete